MTVKRWKAIVGLVLLGASMLATPGSAHHSNSQFDIMRHLQVTGTVRRFQWANPHVWLFLEVSKNGESELWSFEGTSPNVLSRMGWHSKLLQPGQNVTVTGAPTRDGRKIGMLNSMKLADGREFVGIPIPEGFEDGPKPPVTVYN